MNVFTIKDLENLSGIKAHTIRMWEQRYDFLKPQRTESNIRYYDGQELKRILNVALLNKFGFRISNISRMSEDERQEKLLELTQSLACEERFVSELITAMMEMEVKRFEEILDNYILSKGLNKAVQHVIFPFLEKMGLLWTTNHVNPAQEHLVTNIVRQKLIVAIESAYSRVEKKITFLLFLPEGEFHELSLLYVYYILKSKGIPALYLGANISLTDAAAVCKRKKVDYVYLHLTSVTNSFHVNKFLKDLNNQFTPLPVILSGPVMHKLNGTELPEHLHCKQSFADAISFLNSF
ncbi:MAG: MerR family transcriptional regulator [Chitinophagaceae bacterium]|nr:MAG: MerR family transcriptional regulator [Chitinophagaceae bacterium]